MSGAPIKVGMLPVSEQKNVPRAMHRGSRSSAHLDLIRGLAAYAVCISHVTQQFLKDYRPGLSTTAKLFYFLSGFGHQSVMVFFVLSGFFISGSVVDAHRAGRWSWQRYLVARAARLYVVLLPALVLGALWDGLQLFVLHRDGLSEPFAARFTAGTFFGNAFFLQEIRVPVFGSNAPLWSLSYEAWYYLIFPCLLLACLGSRRLISRLLYATAGAAMLLFVGEKIAAFFLVWLLGAVVRALPRSSRRAALGLVAGGLLALAALLFRVGHDAAARGFASDLSIGLAFSLVVYGLASRDEPAKKPDAYARGAERLAGCSYTLYLVHYPMLALGSTLLFGTPDARFEPDATHLAFALTLSAVMVGYAWLLSRVTEARTDAVRAALGTFISRLWPTT